MHAKQNYYPNSITCLNLLSVKPLKRTLRARDHVTHTRCFHAYILTRTIFYIFFWQEFLVVFILYHVICRFSHLIYSHYIWSLNQTLEENLS